MLQPIVFGLNYQTANLELRDRLAFANEEIPVVLKRLLNSGIVKEAILLSTCNRTELYCIASDIEFVINALCDMHNVCPRTLGAHSYVYQGEDCARHLFRVISGLESMVLGETEIVAQIKAAMEIARTHAALGTNLVGLFQLALAVEKEVRSTTEINNVAISMGHAVVKYVNSKIDALANRNILFVGAGQMMQQIAPHFSCLEASKKLIINRTLLNAELVGEKVGAKAAPLSELTAHVADYATVILCCASNSVLLDETVLATDLANAQAKLIIDLSMPLITSKQLKKYPQLEILTVDDIAKLVDVGLEKRKLAAKAADGIIDLKLDDYHDWQRKRGLSPLIKKLRNESDRIRRESLAAAEKQLLNGESANGVLEQLSIQLTNRLLHTPTVNICRQSGEAQDDLVNMVSYLYGLGLEG